MTGKGNHEVAARAVSRRRVLKAGAALPALVWSAPAITLIRPPAALAASPLQGVTARSRQVVQPQPQPHVVTLPPAAAPTAPVAVGGDLPDGLYVGTAATVGMMATAAGVVMRSQRSMGHGGTAGRADGIVADEADEPR